MSCRFFRHVCQKKVVIFSNDPFLNMAPGEERPIPMLSIEIRSFLVKATYIPAKV